MPTERRITGIQVILAIGLILGSGCSRQYWRQQANQEASCIIQEKSNDSRWELRDYRFEAKSDARFYSPYCKDCPPMPQDDPTTNYLMRCVYGKRGWRGWTKHGVTSEVENPTWMQSLPRDNDGTVLLNRRNAMQIALTNSRDYQTALENIYLSALNVSLERFYFDTQFSFGSDVQYDTTFRGYSSIGLTPIDAQLSKNLATGGNFVAGIANSIVWTCGGGESSKVSTTLLNMSLLQPLLRYGGRAYALENLTQAERSLVMNVREMERYREGFYLNIIAGSSGISAPGTGSSGIPSAGSTVSGAGSLYGLIYTQLALDNQRQNVRDLRESMERMEALYESGRLERTQLDQTRQSLLNSQITLLTSENNYKNSLDNYKMDLGLPPGMEVAISDPMLEDFILVSPAVTAMRNVLTQSQHQLRKGKPHAEAIADMRRTVQEATAYCDKIDQDFVKLKEVYPKRVASLKKLVSRPEFRSGSVDRNAADTEVFAKRVMAIGQDYVQFKERLVKFSQGLDKMVPDDTNADQEEDLDLAMDQLNSYLLDMSLIQARIRLDSIMLVPLEMDERAALQQARHNRLDWMNARASLVDQWRQIEIAANALKSNVTVEADARTDLENTKTSSSLSLGLSFDAPLTRQSERNAYVRSLINYDRARRSFIAYEDGVHKNIRSIIRQIEVAQVSFELKRISVLVAMDRVDQANMQLLRPPKPNETLQFGDSFARDLIDAFNALLSAQNAFINDWINFEAYRMGAEIVTGTFRLDGSGMWIDEANEITGANSVLER
ncbi:MAG: TolC family protein [Planctomycetia bacterium]|nr:TolC family protein [Planctomycetia bacterium]